jgi:hypothetical protein
VSEHRLDPVSLVAGVVFLALGIAGLLQAAGWIDGSTLLWSGAGIAAVFGLLGIAASARGLMRTR